MRPFRVTISGLMACVFYLACVLGALMNPTPLWAEAWLTAALAVLAYAVLGAVYARHPGRRIFWGGFAIVGVGFMALNLFSASLPRLVTRSLAERYYGTLSYAPPSSDSHVWALIGQGYQRVRLNPVLLGDPTGEYRASVDMPGVSGRVAAMFLATALRPIGPEEYQQLWNTVLALPLAALGGLMARRFAAEREDPESEA